MGQRGTNVNFCRKTLVLKAQNFPTPRSVVETRKGLSSQWAGCIELLTDYRLFTEVNNPFKCMGASNQNKQKHMWWIRLG